MKKTEEELEDFVPSDNQLLKIQKEIDNLLLRLGIPTSVSVTWDNPRGKINVKSLKDFQTMPVLVKSISLESWASYILPNESFHRAENGGSIKSVWIIKFGMDIHVNYKHFGGGSNGTSLFSLVGYMSGDDLYGDIRFSFP